VAELFDTFLNRRILHIRIVQKNLLFNTVVHVLNSSFAHRPSHTILSVVVNMDRASMGQTLPAGTSTLVRGTLEGLSVVPR
jgi:hypothetical protein